MFEKRDEIALLFVDDDPFLRDKVKAELDGAQAFDGRNFTVRLCASSAEAKGQADSLGKDRRGDFIALVDLSLNDGDDADAAIKGSGIRLIRTIRDRHPLACIIAFSDFDDPRTVRECLLSGADDFVSKKSEGSELIHRINMAGNVLRQHAPTSTHGTVGGSSVIHRSPTMDALARRGARIVPSAVSSILVYGESGTGKEVVADVFADLVGKSRPFLRVNCGAIAPTLLESELFGHMRGAFTGAVSDRRGFFEAASGGWVFLDEVATLTPSAQVALLRVLENHEVVRLGSSKPVPVDVRIIAATNEKLDQLVASGRFRKDLWQRLREVEIELPALRERQGEIPGLVQHFCKIMPGGPYEVTQTVMDILVAAPWSDGNVRELRNCLRAMTEFATPDRRLTPLALPKWLWSDDGRDDQEAGLKVTDLIEGGVSLTDVPRSMQIDIPVAVANPYQYDDICDLALIALVRRIFRERGKVSLRSLSRLIGLSRGTITLKLRAAMDKNLVGIDEIQSLFAMQAKDE